MAADVDSGVSNLQLWELGIMHWFAKIVDIQNKQYFAGESG